MIDLNDVLLAMSNIPVDDPIAEIWGRQMQGGYKIIEYTGSLPITINADGDVLIDYRIYGADGGVGERTENLFDIREVNNPPKCTYSGSTFTITSQGANYDVLCKTNGISAAPIPERMIAVSPGTYTIILGNGTTAPNTSRINVRFFDGETVITPISQDIISPHSRTFTVENNGYLSIMVSSGTIDIAGLMLTKGSTAPASYIPYGYKLPITVQSENLFDKNATNTDNGFIEHSYITGKNQVVEYYSFNVSEYIDIKPDTTYYAQNVSYSLVVACSLCFYTSSHEFISGITYNRRIDVPFTTPANAAYIRMSVKISNLDIVTLTEGTEPPSEYIPYSKQTVPVYIGENQLTEGEYVSYGEQKIYRDVSGTLTPTDPPVPLPEIPTIDGTIVIDYDGTPKPSEMYIKYKGKG